MAVKSQPKFFPNLLNNQQYSGTISTVLYHWPKFLGITLFGVMMLSLSVLITGWWGWLLFWSGLGAFLIIFSILLPTFIVYDWGDQREYDRLAQLGNMDQANVMLDITCGKLRGTRGLLPIFKGGHYFLIDIYDDQKMTDAALQRVRAMEPPLEPGRRIYERPGKPNRLPVPHNWADVIYCNFSLYDLQDKADKEAILAEFSRVLKPGGRLLIAEPVLEHRPGWQHYLTEAKFTIQHHERWRGLVHLWVATQKRA